MSEEENPYRFTGGAAERVGTTRPQDPLRSLRTIALLRSLLSVALAFHVPSLVFFLVASAIQGWSPPNARRMDDHVVGLASVATCVGYTVVVIFGVMLIPRACPGFGRTATALILMPALNVVVAFLALRDSKRMLEAHGVRLGWVRCNYSRAAIDGPPPDAMSDL